MATTRAHTQANVQWWGPVIFASALLVQLLADKIDAGQAGSLLALGLAWLYAAARTDGLLSSSDLQRAAAFTVLTAGLQAVPLAIDGDLGIMMSVLSPLPILATALAYPWLVRYVVLGAAGALVAVHPDSAYTFLLANAPLGAIIGLSLGGRLPTPATAAASAVTLSAGLAALAYPFALPPLGMEIHSLGPSGALPVYIMASFIWAALWTMGAARFKPTLEAWAGAKPSSGRHRQSVRRLERADSTGTAPFEVSTNRLSEYEMSNSTPAGVLSSERSSWLGGLMPMGERGSRGRRPEPVRTVRNIRQWRD